MTGIQSLASAAPPVPAVVPPTRPRRAPRWWLWVAALLVALGLGAVLYLQPWAPVVPPVVIELATQGPVSRVLAVNGRVAGVVLVDLRPLVSGALVDVDVKEGDAVQSGTVLARIDPATQAAVVRQAMAGLDAALVAQADAQAAYARTGALGGAVARVELEAAARNAQTAAQDVARMTALLEQAQLQLAKFTLKAPIAGTVLQLNVAPGQTVDPSTVVMTIADLDQLVVKADVDESFATQIRLDQPAALQLAGEAEVRSGRVSFVSQRVDAMTGGLAIELTADRAIMAPIGLTVTANITVDTRVEALTVPRAAILRDQNGTAVLVVRDGVARRQAVSVIEWPAARLIVTGGLTAGDAVISDATGVVDGQAVKVAP